MLDNASMSILGQMLQAYYRDAMHCQVTERIAAALVAIECEEAQALLSMAA